MLITATIKANILSSSKKRKAIAVIVKSGNTHAHKTVYKNPKSIFLGMPTAICMATRDDLMLNIITIITAELTGNGKNDNQT